MLSSDDLKGRFLCYPLQMSRLICWFRMKSFLQGPDSEVLGLGKAKKVTLSKPDDGEWFEKEESAPQYNESLQSFYAARGWKQVGEPVVCKKDDE